MKENNATSLVGPHFAFFSGAMQVRAVMALLPVQGAAYSVVDPFVVQQ